MFIPLIISFREICVVTALLPLVTLSVCFVTAYLFQADEVHETHCKVYNIIPSISAITGVSPQRYLWRVCIALHIGPRFAIAAVYRNFYRALNAKLVPAEHRPGIHVLIKVVFVLHLVEIASLCCVTYVSNKENYRELWQAEIDRGRELINNLIFLAIHCSCAREVLHHVHGNVPLPYVVNHQVAEPPAALATHDSGHRELDVVEEGAVRRLIGQHCWTDHFLPETSPTLS